MSCDRCQALLAELEYTRANLQEVEEQLFNLQNVMEAIPVSAVNEWLRAREQVRAASHAEYWASLANDQKDPKPPE